MTVPSSMKKWLASVGTALIIFLVAREWDYRATLSKRLGNLEIDNSKWNALVDHENRLRIVETQSSVTHMIVNEYLKNMLSAAAYRDYNNMTSEGESEPPGAGPDPYEAATPEQQPVDLESFKEQHKKSSK